MLALGAQRSKATHLARGRAVGDPAADAVVRRWIAEGPRAMEAVDDALSKLAVAPSARADLPPSLRRFLGSHGPPAWADHARLARAQDFAARHSVAIACALFCAALPAAFTGAKGAAVLHATKRLEDDIDRRVNETGRFVFDVTAPGSFTTGRAVLAAQCVRLVHAVVRARAARFAPPGEVPINQEDLAGTVVCFSVVVLDSLSKLGIVVGAQDAEDYVHLWAVVGALLGMRRRWIPRDLHAARALGATIRAAESASSAAGRELAAALVDGIERHLPGRGLGVVAPSMIRFLAGDPAGQTLALREGIREADLARVVPRVARACQSLGGALLGRHLPTVGRRVLEATIERKLAGGAPAYFRPFTSSGCPHIETREVLRADA